MMSIATSGRIYWAKAFSSKLSQTILGVKFSTDGALLIAHSSSLSSNSFILVIETSTGTVKSARNYRSGLNTSYNYLIKSVLVSSGASPMAYVLTNY